MNKERSSLDYAVASADASAPCSTTTSGNPEIHAADRMYAGFSNITEVWLGSDGETAGATITCAPLSERRLCSNTAATTTARSSAPPTAPRIMGRLSLPPDEEFDDEVPVCCCVSPVLPAVILVVMTLAVVMKAGVVAVFMVMGVVMTRVLVAVAMNDVEVELVATVVVVVGLAVLVVLVVVKGAQYSWPGRISNPAEQKPHAPLLSLQDSHSSFSPAANAQQ